MKRKLILVSCALAVSGCIAQTDIQAKYMAQEEDCRDHATSRTGVDGAGSSVAAQFSDCMNKSGWHISGPKSPTPPTQVVQNPPTGSPSTNPSAAMVAAPGKTAAIVSPPTGAPSVNPSAAISSGVATTSGTAAAASVAPGVNPAAAVAAPQPASMAPRISEPAPATYQPARPSGSPAVPYGEGAGRQF